MYMCIIKHLKKESLEPSFSEDDDHLHVYLYFHDHGFPEKLGHTDIGAGNTILSYGCHDPMHRSFPDYSGNGILIQAEHLPFLYYHATSGEMIIDYTLNLTEEETMSVLHKTDTLLKQAVPWHCPYETDPNANDYASKLYQNIPCKFFQMKDSAFETYNALNNNCVTFVYDLVKEYLPSFNPLIHTPHAFLRYMESQFSHHDPHICTRDVYYSK